MGLSVFIYIFGLLEKDTAYYILLLQAGLFGFVLYHWSKDEQYLNEKNDRLRKKIYDLELVQSHLLSDYHDTEKIARLTERQKIAEHLHDNLGHELTGAHLSLKAYKTLLTQNKQKQAKMLLEKVEEKLTSSLEQLKVQ